jgi:hypothetical protein
MSLIEVESSAIAELAFGSARGRVEYDEEEEKETCHNHKQYRSMYYHGLQSTDIISPCMQYLHTHLYYACTQYVFIFVNWQFQVILIACKSCVGLAKIRYGYEILYLVSIHLISVSFHIYPDISGYIWI